MSIGLTHQQAVASTIENLDLVNLIQLGPCEVSLSVDNNAGFPFSVSKLPKSCRFLLVSVFVYYSWQPQLVNIYRSEGIEGFFWLKIMVGCSVLLPFQKYRKLNVYGVVLFLDIHQFEEVYGYQHINPFIL